MSDTESIKLRFEGVTKVLGGQAVLDGIDLAVRTGETLAIVGSSGAGKSVTLKHMVRLMSPDTGRVFVDDDCISDATGAELARLRARFGYLFQGGALLAWLSVFENIALPLREQAELDDAEIVERVHQTLAMVGLEDDGDKRPAEISGGMRKRAGLARAIVTRPGIILYDEPTSGLDPVSSRMIDALIDRLRQELNVTSVVVTHDLHSALSIGSRIAMLDGGRIVELADPDALIRSDNQHVKDFLSSQFITTEGSWERTDT